MTILQTDQLIELELLLLKYGMDAHLFQKIESALIEWLTAKIMTVLMLQQQN